MLPATHTAGGYRASMDGEILTVHGVPIFCACERGDVQFDDRWIKAAVTNALQQQRDNYHPPLHIRHHGDTGDVKAAGYFTITGAAPITFKGTQRTAILASLTITDPATQAEVLAGRLPYRSVEIFDVDKPSIDSLALLDHEAPFLELPMLMVSESSQPHHQPRQRSGLVVRESDGMADVPGENFGMTYERAAGDAVVGSFHRGKRAFQLFRAETMSTTETPELSTVTTFGEGVLPVHLASDDGPPKKDDDKDEDMEGDTALDVGGVVKAIESGSISIADMDMILAAIQSQGAAAEEPEAEQPAPAAAPGAEAMKKIPDATAAKFAKMQGKIDALTAAGTERDQATARDNEVANAVSRLAGRPLGADIKVKLFKYHSDHGPDAFAAYVDSMAETFGVLPAGGDAAAAFQVQVGKVPEVAMAFQAQGSTAVEQAAGFARDWDDLKAHGLPVRTTQKRHVELSMARIARQEN